MNICMNILKEPEIFIPAAALLVAILIFWTQLWLRWGESAGANKFNIALGFVWTIIAIMYALVAIIWAVTREIEIDNVAIGLFFAALLMGVFNVFIEVVSSLSHVFGCRDVGQSLFTIDDLTRLWAKITKKEQKTDEKKAKRKVSALMLVFAALLACFSILQIGIAVWATIGFMAAVLILVSVIVGIFTKRGNKKLS